MYNVSAYIIAIITRDAVLYDTLSPTTSGIFLRENKWIFSTAGYSGVIKYVEDIKWLHLLSLLCEWLYDRDLLFLIHALQECMQYISEAYFIKI